MLYFPFFTSCGSGSTHALSRSQCQTHYYAHSSPARQQTQPHILTQTVPTSVHTPKSTEYLLSEVCLLEDLSAASIDMLHQCPLAQLLHLYSCVYCRLKVEDSGVSLAVHHFPFDSAITWFCVCVCSAVIFYSSVLQSSTVKLQPNMVHIRGELPQGHWESKSLHQILCRHSSWHMAQCNKQPNPKLSGTDLHICWRKIWGLRAQLKSSLSQWEEALPLSLLQYISTHIAINIGVSCCTYCNTLCFKREL